MIYFEPGNFTLSELMALIKSVTAMILNNIAVKQNIIIPPCPEVEEILQHYRTTETVSNRELGRYRLQ